MLFIAYFRIFLIKKKDQDREIVMSANMSFTKINELDSKQYLSVWFCIHQLKVVKFVFSSNNYGKFILSSNAFQ